MDKTTRMTPEQFVALIDEHVTPPMQRLGYTRIHLDEVVFDVGYEADNDEVRARILPDDPLVSVDPLSADEIWVSYDPETDRLRFGGAYPILTTSAYVAFHQTALNARQPIDARIRYLGEAIAAFGETQTKNT